jgi:hypothetical protein
MIYHFDNVSKNQIIDSILKLHDIIPNAKLKINISLGKLFNIDDGVVVVSDNNKIYNIGINSLKKEDLIIVLRYLQNMEKCREIILKESRYGEYLDVRKKIWIKVPTNQEDVKTKLKEYLSKKKNEAIVNHGGKIIDFSIQKIGNRIKKRIIELKFQFKKNAELYYDNIDKRFIIIIDKYDESEFGMNLIHLLSEIEIKFKQSCIILSFKDFTKEINRSTKRLIPF